MITLTRMDGKEVLINETWLVAVEENPDTTLIFSNGLKLIVKQSRKELTQRILGWDARHAGKPPRKPKR